MQNKQNKTQKQRNIINAKHKTIKQPQKHKTNNKTKQLAKTKTTNTKQTTHKQ